MVLPEGRLFCPKADCFARRPVVFGLVFFLFFFWWGFFFSFIICIIRWLICPKADCFARRPIVLPKGQLFCPKANCFAQRSIVLPEGRLFCPKAGCFAQRPIWLGNMMYCRKAQCFCPGAWTKKHKAGTEREELDISCKYELVVSSISTERVFAGTSFRVTT